jgi:hypothetical protein
MADKATPVYDTPQRLVVSYVYQLPFGRRRTYARNWSRAADTLLGGWQVTGITSYMSGFPFAPTMTTNLDNGYSNVPNRVCDGRLAVRRIDRWYDTTCFVPPPFNVYGNRGFGILRGPGFRNWDVGVMKRFNFTESRYLEFRGELLNMPTHVNFGLPNAFQCGGGCGEGVITSLASAARKIQFALKLYY